MSFATYVLWSLRLSRFKTKGQTYDKTEIKIVANPGLA